MMLEQPFPGQVEVQQVEVHFDVAARMRDGTTLRANVYRPDGVGPWPTLLTRLPYGKDDPSVVTPWLDPVRAARAGFLVVVQDTRGCGASEGEWLPWRFERADGADSVEWAAALAGSNGKVGMFGCSYAGMTQWLAAIEQPPALAAIAPGLTVAEPLDGAFARGGALELGLDLPWTLEMAALNVGRLTVSDEERRQRLTAILEDHAGLTASGYWYLPVADNPALNKHGVPDIGTFRMLADPDVASWCRVRGSYHRVLVPSFHIGGWYDLALQGTLDSYAAMTTLGRPTRLLVGPWSHEPSLSDPIGEVCFGVAAGAQGMPDGDLTSLQLAWFSEHLRSDLARDPGPSKPPVRLFVMGRNEWRDADSWPLDRTREVTWFLRSGGVLHQMRDAGSRGVAEFVYDPEDPAPTVGGHTVMWPAFMPGAMDQRIVEERTDVCVFTSDPLGEDLEVTGRVRAILHVESSAPSTDWVVRLCDVYPDGRSINVCDGIFRMSGNADECQRVEIDLWSTSIAFLSGHRLRVQVTSSSFPRWDRNLNTGHQDKPQVAVAHQRVYLSGDRPSFIEIPTKT